MREIDCVTRMSRIIKWLNWDYHKIDKGRNQCFFLCFLHHSYVSEILLLFGPDLKILDLIDLKDLSAIHIFVLLVKLGYKYLIWNVKLMSCYFFIFRFFFLIKFIFQLISFGCFYTVLIVVKWHLTDPIAINLHFIFWSINLCIIKTCS